jgi:predicted phage terminase large subunit-like protein
MSDKVEEIYEKQIIKWKCENDLLFFARYFFKYRENAKFIINTHHKIIKEHLEKVESGEIKNLIINVSPGSSKTELVVINFMAQQLAKNPRARFLHISYSDELAALNSQKTKDIILSDAYQELWPLTIRSDSKAKKRWNVQYRVPETGEIKDGGGCYAVSLRGSITGFRAGHMQPGFQGAIIVDDALKVEDAYSTHERERANRLILSTVKSRKASPETPIILIMQRLHELDPTGFLLGGGTGDKWHHLKIPAILEDENGEEVSYWEQKEPIEDLKKMRSSAPYVFAGQYMQNPAPIGGGVFKREFVQTYDSLSPSFSVNTMNIWLIMDGANAKTKKSDYTAIWVWGLAPDNNYYLLDLVRDRLNPKERVEAFISMHRKWNKRSGKPPNAVGEEYGMMTDNFYIQEEMNRQNYRFHIYKVGGKMKKEDRIMRLVAPWEARRIYLPNILFYTDATGKRRDLIKELIEDELMLFPAGANDDMIDAASRIFEPDLYAHFPQVETYLSAGESMADRQAAGFDANNFMTW